ncbi:MAG: HDOD domain-containing protein [Sulfuricurvum sp.]|uniref:HDOD domain-containing protein n=1 Tax=Sulfuricurvum sp. TaxID=2025608 RepID=UPI002614D154|nr:HDOD domain-containing protein [Sulfuricurvum sp.]MDD2829538.1 HDOD domain-containing protein [Sulfuricurvum sp.]MDD4950470.1 HDOD domain-containing protein [Sulfuricurvum sp.]
MDDFLLYSIESFPPLRETILKLNDLYNAEEINNKAVERLVESDPLLYTDILRYANSPQYGFKKPLSNISQVISLFGLNSLKGMAMVAALKAHPFNDLTPFGITIEIWFKVMERQQAFLNLWLGKTERHLLKSLGALPFILEIGRLIASYALMFASNPYRFTKNSPQELLLEEKNIIGSSGDELACKLFELWFFDTTLINCLQYSLAPAYAHDPKLCAVLKCARLLFTLKGIEPFETIEPILEEYSLNITSAKLAYETITGEIT